MELFFKFIPLLSIVLILLIIIGIQPLLKKSGSISQSILTGKQKNFRICIIFVMFVIFCCTFFIVMHKSFEDSAIYKITIEEITTNIKTKELIGDKIKLKGIITGSISNSDDNNGDAEISFNVSSTNGVFKIFVIGIKEHHTWKITNLYVNDNEIITSIDYDKLK